MISGFQGLPQNPSNQRPTIALLSCSRDIFSTLIAVNEGALAFWRGVSTLGVRVVDIRFLRSDCWSSHRWIGSIRGGPHRHGSAALKGTRGAGFNPSDRVITRTFSAFVRLLGRA